LVRKPPNAVDIKGFGKDVNIIFNEDAAFSDVKTELIKWLKNSDRFLSGVKVILDTGDRIISAEECEILRQILIDRFKIVVSAVRSGSNETQEAAKKIGWKVEPQKPKQKPKQKPEKVRAIEPSEIKNDSFLFRGTLRSGQSILHRGNIVIVGDVNPGAEVLATGHIVIMGMLRGVAHAGVEGDITAEIVALNLNPIQLRIAQYIGRSPDLKLEANNAPEVARVEDGNIVIHKLK